MPYCPYHSIVLKSVSNISAVNQEGKTMSSETMDYHDIINSIKLEPSDEIFVWDKNKNIIYVDGSCVRHYSFPPEFFIGKNVNYFINNEHLWSPASNILNVYIEPKINIYKQTTHLDIDIITISIPIVVNNQLEYIIQLVKEAPSTDSTIYSDLSKILYQEKTDIDLIYNSPQMEGIISLLASISPASVPVLLLGETGTGKSHIAKYIHNKSSRKNKPFIHINIASLSPSIIESELFGYVKGAFTGADKTSHKGLFERADGGTLFIDEIGEMPYHIQSKLLHVLQENEVLPMGGSFPVKIDVRIISATNADIKSLISTNKFRKDLYYRLNLFEITIPPLRERKSDIELLASSYLARFNKKYNKKVSFSKDILSFFLNYDWPGNIRELVNIIEKGVIISNDSVMDINCLPKVSANFNSVPNCEISHILISDFDTAVNEYKKKLIVEAYEKYPSTRQLAKHFSISQSKASRLISEYVKKPDHKRL